MKRLLDIALIAALLPLYPGSIKNGAFELKRGWIVSLDAFYYSFEFGRLITRPLP
jgi:hypothetical protein